MRRAAEILHIETLLYSALVTITAITLLLLDRNRVHGAINILWVKTAYAIEAFAMPMR
jgi:hypothetical protein